MAGPWTAVPVALLYAVLVLPRLGEVSTAVSNPTLTGITALLGEPVGATIAWVHFLAFDLFVALGVSGRPFAPNLVLVCFPHFVLCADAGAGWFFALPGGANGRCPAASPYFFGRRPFLSYNLLMSISIRQRSNYSFWLLNAAAYLTWLGILVATLPLLAGAPNRALVLSLFGLFFVGLSVFAFLEERPYLVHLYLLFQMVMALMISLQVPVRAAAGISTFPFCAQRTSHAVFAAVAGAGIDHDFHCGNLVCWFFCG